MKKVLVTGHFNILHLGHIRLLNYAKSLGDYLVVGVESDLLAANNVTYNEKYRLEAIKNLSVVDEVLVFNKIQKLIKDIKPQILVKGKEYENKRNQEIISLKKNNVKLVYSSANFVEVIEDEYSKNKISLVRDNKFLKRNKIQKQKLIKIISNFKKLKVCVIGDFIADEYIKCSPIGMSQEDFTLTYRKESSTKFIGGSAVVASHAARFGAQVDYFSVIGENDKNGQILENLKLNNLSKFIFYDSDRPTTLKQRFRAIDKNILKLSILNESSINVSLQNKIYNKISQLNKHYDLVIFSDFNYGVLNKNLVLKLFKYFKKNKTFIASDSQYSSQIGDMDKFKFSSLITPTEHEVRSLLKDNDSGLIVLIDKLKKRLKCKNIILKLGGKGVLMHSKINSKWIDDSLSAMNKNPKDVNGAGDTMLAISSLSLALGSTIWEASYLASIAAALQVGKIGNAKIDIKEIIKYL